ncbi:MULTISPECIES: hypothetical protein [unclassified Nostoc]|uniref:hypothetical protein n=1 Tax=unclassified Nostoc TaxID=2593658 RepID=UPI000CF34B9D|nr:hypothetical protein [Nostoc sp. 'Lobaria pulmonaria (5183) cyanobiont']
MIISDLNYLENTSEEIIGGGNTVPNKPPKPKKYFNFAEAFADSSASGGLVNLTSTVTETTTTKNSATSSSASAAQTSS